MSPPRGWTDPPSLRVSSGSFARRKVPRPVNKKSVLTVIAGAVLVCVVGLGATAWYLHHKTVGAGARTARLPHDAWLVVTVDVAQARAWPAAASIRNWLTNPGSDASQGSQAAARRYRDIVAACGFDPWAKVDTATAGIDRTVLTGRAEADVATYMDGSFTQDQARRCLTGLAGFNHRTITPAEVGHHPVLTYPGSADGSPTQQFALLGRSVLVADQRYMPHALAIADGTSPGLPADSGMVTMLGQLGASNLFNLVADLHAVHANDPREMDRMVDAVAQDNPTIAHLDGLKGVLTSGVGLRVVDNAVTLSIRLDLPTSATAGTTATALHSVLEARRPDLLRLLDQGQASLSMVQATASLSGTDLTRASSQVSTGIVTLREVAQQVRVNAQGTTVVVTLNFSARQVAALEGAVRGLADVLTAVSRTVRGFPGLSAPTTGLGVPTGPLGSADFTVGGTPPVVPR